MAFGLDVEKRFYGLGGKPIILYFIQANQLGEYGELWGFRARIRGWISVWEPSLWSLYFYCLFCSSPSMCQPQPQPSRQLLPASPRHPPRLHSRSHFCHFNGFGREWVMRENFFIRSGTKDLKIKLVEFASGECQNKLCSEELSKKVDLISAVISLLSYTFPQNILTTTFSLSCWTFPQGLPATRCPSLSLEWQAVFYVGGGKTARISPESCDKTLRSSDLREESWRRRVWIQRFPLCGSGKFKHFGDIKLGFFSYILQYTTFQLFKTKKYKVHKYAKYVSNLQNPKNKCKDV